MSEFTKGCLALVATGTILLVFGVWVFDSQAAKQAVACAFAGYSIPMIYRLWPLRPWRRNRQ